MLRSDSIAYPPRGLSREQSARYVGVSTTMFDAMVEDGRMPRPKRTGGRVLWDRLSLDSAFDDLPGDKSPIQKALDRARAGG